MSSKRTKPNHRGKAEKQKHDYHQKFETTVILEQGEWEHNK